MNQCLVLLITRGLRLWIPPEIYLAANNLASLEAERWRENPSPAKAAEAVRSECAGPSSHRIDIP